MTDYADPTDLKNYHAPAAVNVTEQGTVFVAKASDLDSGWLHLRYWDGTGAKLPPHRVLAVEYLDTEIYGEPDEDGMKSRRITDEDWRERAKEMADDTDERLVTDGGYPEWETTDVAAIGGSVWYPCQSCSAQYRNQEAAKECCTDA